MGASLARGAAMKRAWFLCTVLQGANNRHSADTVFNLGVTAQLSGDPAGALPLFKRALGIYRAHLAADHPAILRTQQRIAEL